MYTVCRQIHSYMAGAEPHVITKVHFLYIAIYLNIFIKKIYTFGLI